MLRRLKTIRTLGLGQTGWFALYKFGLLTGHYRRSSPVRRLSGLPALHPVWPVPGRQRLVELLDVSARADLLAEAQEIVGGQVRLFGGPAVALCLEPPGDLRHWTDYELGRAGWGVEDVKFIWEPARFGWVYPLGRAYRLTGDETVAKAFWRGFERFDAANPPNLGPNWASAQEVALRLLGFLFAAHVFAGAGASSPPRLARLTASIAEHAQRIPLTLPYARAQHNNHLVSEAVGLIAAGLALPDWPAAPGWLRLGKAELEKALLAQIDPDGTYAQHSVNYHRLMLQAALLAEALLRGAGMPLAGPVRERLGHAAAWLRGQLDPVSGRAPNLGHNDGAHILPLAPGEYADLRPTVQAACLAFTGQPALPNGSWDELGLWLGLDLLQTTPSLAYVSPSIPRMWRQDGWASLRAVRYHSRPAHADPLHVEIWQGGHNLALDAGTYRYNAAPPWDNGLASVLVHNTVSVDGLEPMTRASKFLWLDWVQAQLESVSPESIAARHTGYARLGVELRRSLARCPDGWEINDELLPLGGDRAEPHQAVLHWLLPDWPWTQEDSDTMVLRGPGLDVRVRLQGGEGGVLQLVRAGQVLFGPAGAPAVLGWQSPTYALRLPALSLRWLVRGKLPLRISSHFTLLLPPKSD